jgi:hypothetical protein
VKLKKQVRGHSNFDELMRRVVLVKPEKKTKPIKRKKK